MVWVNYIADFILSPLYVYLLCALVKSNDPYFHSPFFTFFISSGISGLITVAAYIPLMHFIFTTDLGWLFLSFLALNHVGAISSTIGKLYIVLHRFAVLRRSTSIEKTWSNNIVRTLVALQFVLPICTSIPIFVYQYHSVKISNGTMIVGGLANEWFLFQKFFSSSVYAIYTVLSIGFTVAACLQFSRMSRVANSTNGSKRLILNQQKHMVIVTVVCCISHLLKAAHQVFWGYLAITGTLDSAKLTPYMITIYLLTNGFATYLTPIVLVILSRKVRKALMCA